MLNVGLAGDHRMGNCCSPDLTVAGDVYNGVFLCCPFFPRDVLDESLDLIESVLRVFLPTLLYMY